MTEPMEARVKDGFRSNGERHVARILDGLGIPYEYEPDIYLKDGDKRYIWHPDFHLPQYQTIVEYLGLTGNHDYDLMTEKKTRVYGLNHYHFIPVYPETLSRNCQGYITRSIYNHLLGRLNHYCRKMVSYKR